MIGIVDQLWLSFPMRLDYVSESLSVLCSKKLMTIDWNSQKRWNLFAILITKNMILYTESLMNYGQRFMTLYRRQESKQSPRKRNAKKSKMAVWGGLTNSCEKKRSEKERYTHLNAEFQRIARRDKKAFFSTQCKKNRGKQ